MQFILDGLRSNEEIIASKANENVPFNDPEVSVPNHLPEQERQMSNEVGRTDDRSCFTTIDPRRAVRFIGQVSDLDQDAMTIIEIFG